LIGINDTIACWCLRFSSTKKAPPMFHTALNDWLQMAAYHVPAVRELHKASLGVMKAFRELGAAAHKAGALDPKAKEWLAVAISVVARR
jgi:alkylhydroperoxidase/carboxymuconolactone decarboxylase family protein YurZ